MAACAFASKLLPLLVRGGRFSSRAPCPAPSAVRAFSCPATRCQLHRVEGTNGALTGKVDRFGGVTVNLADISLPADISESSFSRMLQDSLLQWKAEGKVAVWLRVPISLSRCAAAASTHGFTFHHAKDDHTVLALWLGEGESRLPGFATHQIGVAGTLYRGLDYDGSSTQPGFLCMSCSTKHKNPVRDNRYHYGGYQLALLTQAFFRLCVHLHKKGRLMRHLTLVLHKVKRS